MKLKHVDSNPRYRIPYHVNSRIDKNAHRSDRRIYTFNFIGHPFCGLVRYIPITVLIKHKPYRTYAHFRQDSSVFGTCDSANLAPSALFLFDHHIPSEAIKSSTALPNIEINRGFYFSRISIVQEIIRQRALGERWGCH